MIKSITYFQEKITKKLQKTFLSYSFDMTKFAELVYGVIDCMIEFGLRLLAEELENYDTFLCEKRHLRPDWYIVRKDETTLLTSLGILHYHKTLFQNKKTVDYLYIEADEDHVALQFREKKGDITKNEYHQKNNGAIAKLIYVHEGTEKETDHRHVLKNTYY